jgi:Protein of unknown function (DUF4235)
VTLLYRLHEPACQRVGRDPLPVPVFKKVWAAVSGEEEAPEATSAEYSTQEVLVAAAVQGAISLW